MTIQTLLTYDFSDEKYVKEILAAVAANTKLVHESHKGVTLLHKASASGNLKLAQELMTKGANINARDDADLTPLDYALRAGQTEFAVELLLQTTEPTLANLMEIARIMSYSAPPKSTTLAESTEETKRSSEKSRIVGSSGSLNLEEELEEELQGLEKGLADALYSEAVEKRGSMTKLLQTGYEVFHQSKDFAYDMLSGLVIASKPTIKLCSTIARDAASGSAEKIGAAVEAGKPIVRAQAERAGVYFSRAAGAVATVYRDLTETPETELVFDDEELVVVTSTAPAKKVTGQ